MATVRDLEEARLECVTLQSKIERLEEKVAILEADKAELQWRFKIVQAGSQSRVTTLEQRLNWLLIRLAEMVDPDDVKVIIDNYRKEHLDER